MNEIMMQTTIRQKGYQLIGNVQREIRSKRGQSFLRGLLCLFMLLMINFQITSFLEEEGTAIKDSIHSGAGATTEEYQTPIRPGQEGTDAIYYNNETVQFNGIQNAEWCRDPSPHFPPLPYDSCKFNEFLFKFELHGSLASALNFLLKGAVWAYDENICYFIDPRESNLVKRNPPLEDVDPFIDRYFEPLGLSIHHPKARAAINLRKVISPDPHQIQHHMYGLFYGGLAPLNDTVRHQKKSLESLYVYNKGTIWIRKYVLRRLFRIKKHVQNTACSILSGMGLNEEYIAVSIRRGENEIENSLQSYIDRAEKATDKHFGGNVPTIFVASDDCSVMSEIRNIRPSWKFVGPCDVTPEETGFVLSSMSQWTVDQTDKHITKFIIELIGMASAKHFIGVSTTNVAFWVYFMRHMKAEDDTWEFIDSDLYPL